MTNGEDVLQELSRMSVIFLNYFLSFQTSCTAESIDAGYVGSCRVYEQCRSHLQAHLGSDLEALLKEVKAVFVPDPSKPCFTAETVLNELNKMSEELEDLPRDVSVVLLLMSHLYAGECIDAGESVTDFLDDLFLHYGNGCTRVMTQSGFTKLWNDLQMLRTGKHIDHGVEKNSCAPLNPSQHGFTVTPSNGFMSVLLMPPSENGSGESLSYLVGQTRRRARHTTFSEGHKHKNLANECLPSHDLLQRFLTPGNQEITSSEFLQLCPALVQQAVSGVCSTPLRAGRPKSNETSIVQENIQNVSQSTTPWLAVAAVSLITLVSFITLFLLPLLKKSFFLYINAFFTGLAFGTMSGDVVLHIMPQYLRLHRHNESGHGDDEETLLDHLFPSYLQRQLVFLFTMYLLFLMESIFSAFSGEKKEHHGHSHGSVDIALREMNAVEDMESSDVHPKLSNCFRISEILKPSKLFSGMSSKAVVIVLADTVHNFADGMAIAVGFSMSYKDGLSTSIAVFFHELPHEIGDFAILLNCGLSYSKAFIFNVLSGLTAFVGLGVGVFAANLFREWLLCITAGLFFFVVMGEMLPDMRLESRVKWREFAVKIVGTMLGMITMICIAIYELSTS